MPARSGRWLFTCVVVTLAVSLPAVGRPAAAVPRVRIVQPADDALVGGRVEIRAEVDGARPEQILFVEFEVDGRVLFADSTAPFELVWYARTAGPHEIVARVFTARGEVDEDRIRTAPMPAVEGATFESRVEQVELFVRLEGSVPPRDLHADDFTVLEDGRPQHVLTVERSADLPVAIGFLVDASGSMVERLGLALDSAGDFIDGLVRRQQDKAFVMSFADLPSMLQEFTNDVGRLASSLDLITTGRHTLLFDSLVAAARQFEGHAGRRALVVLTDGHDAGSRARLDDAIREAQRYDVAIYPVAVGLGSQYFFERWVLERLARATGGRISDLRALDDPRRIYEGIADDLHAQYRLTYRPGLPGGSGEWRELTVRLADGIAGRHPRVRTRPGYFAE